MTTIRRARDTCTELMGMNGEASLWMEEFRGEVVASMVYDGRPVHDRRSPTTTP